ncbi:MAG: ExbD/TolR family protein [Methyloceanibacter sp.]|jgi:biopolymer transport protein TolR|nr:ExbD/TolR family protein [Methyloceanibacter sp.]
MGVGLQPGGGLSNRRARRRSAAPMSEINVTPMVDVMLVLLIIFMVTAPLLTAGIEVVPQPDLPKVELPKTEAGPIDSQKQALAITIDPQGKVFLQNTEIGFDELLPKLAAIRDAGAGDRVEVRGDDRAQYGSVAKVLARIKAAGIAVTLVTEPVAATDKQ